MSVSIVEKATTQQEQEQIAVDFVTAFKEGKLGSMPDESNPFWNQCNALTLSVETSQEQREETLLNIRRGCKQFDNLLSPYDPQPEEKQPDLLDCPDLPKYAQLQPSLSIGVCPWLDEYIKHSKRCSPEGYKDFHTFCGVMVLSTIAARRVCIPMGVETLYTNLYCMICSPSTKFAKSTTANVWKRIIEELGLSNLYQQKHISAQKLTSEMSGSVSKGYEGMTLDQKTAEQQRITWAGQKCLYYDEYGKVLKSIFQEKSVMQEMQRFLLEAYDCTNELGKSTFSRGDEIPDNPYLSVLGLGVTETLQNTLRKGAEGWLDGLMARTVIICSEGACVRKTAAFVREKVPDTLTGPLEKWHTALGLPKVEIEAVEENAYTAKFTSELKEHECIMPEDKEAFKAYDRYREALNDISNKDSFPRDLIASYGRLDKVAVKMAMLFASLDACVTGKRIDDVEITLKHWAKAQELAEVLRKSLHEFYCQVTGQYRTPKASREYAILAALKHYASIQKEEKDKPVSISVLRNRSRSIQQYSCEEIESSMKWLVSSGQVGFDTKGKATKYFPAPENK
jgi:hypothetical protein